MTSLDRTLSQASRRLLIVRCIPAMLGGLVIALLALAGLRIAEKAFAFGGLDWGLAWSLAVAGGVVFGAVWVLVTRHDRAAVAHLLDERLGLKTTIATALWARTREDDWSRASVAQGEDVARRAVVRDAIPARTPRWWPVVPTLAAAVLLTGFLPQTDLMALIDTASEEEAGAEAVEAQMIEVKAAVDESDAAVSEALKEMGAEDLLKELEAANEEKPQTPEELQKAQMRKLTTLSDKLEEMAEKGDLAAAKAMEDLSKRLRQPAGEQSEVTKLAQAMQRGDFEAARRALNELLEQARNGELSAEQQEALAKQLEDLAKQLEELAKQQDALAQALQQAGIDPNLMNDPEALQQAIQNSQNLTQAQKQALQQKMQAMNKACQACQNAGGAMQQMAKAMQQGQMGQLGQQGGQQLGEQLSQMEMMQQQLQQMQGARQMLANQMNNVGQCNGGGASMLPNWAQKHRSTGPGAGSSGSGGERDEQDRSNQTVAEQTKNTNRINPNGPIIGTTLVEGPAVRGESRAEFREAARAGGRAVEEAIDEKLIPREYEDVLKQYFGGLEEEADAGAPAESG
jgi:hypothetical protein